MTSNSCLFCKIIKKEAPAKLVYEDQSIIGFEDINPQAPVHILLAPKKHISSLTELSPQDREVIGSIYLVAKKVAQEKDIGNGFRIVVNSGAQAGQSVPHVHFHLLGGRKFSWPPG